MTLDDFTAVAATRIPTPGELVGFVRGQGWTVTLSGGSAKMSGVPEADRPLARALAGVLTREPFRSGVLRELLAAPVRESPPPDRLEQALAALERKAGEVKAPAVGREPLPTPETCPGCAATVYLPGPEIAAACPHPPERACPYFRLSR